MANLIKRNYISILSVSVFLLLWEIGSRVGFLPSDYVGTPSKIFIEFFGLFTAQNLSDYLLPSVESLFLGLALAIIMGVVLGYAIGMNITVRKIFKPFLFAINAVPAVVFFPLIILTLGISLQSVILTIVLMCFVPVMINVMEGVSSTDSQLLSMADSFGSKKLFVLKNIIFYSTLPYIFAGTRAAIGKSVIALIVAELYGLNQGIGYLVSYYGSTFQINKLMSLVLFILVLNGILFTILMGFEKLFKRVTT
jgi:NitT/TauT family transport system permease protein